MSNRTVGILDIGRARLKGSAWDRGPGLRPTWIGTKETDLARLDALVREMVKELRLRSPFVISYSASLFRDDARLRDTVGPTVAEISDLAVQLSAHDEGLLLLSSASRGPDDVLLDIGGGSIQLIWHEAGSAVVRSWPFGTWALEKTYGLRQGSPASVYAEVRDVITGEVERTVEPRGRRLLVGSNIMADFFGAVGPYVGKADGDWQVADLNRARMFCASLDQRRFAEVFPQNPDFMHGGDKAMLVAEAVATALSAHASPTNASVAHGMALEAHKALAANGLESISYPRLVSVRDASPI